MAKNKYYVAQKKYQESIDNYQKYLDLLVTREQTNEKDTAVSDYTLGNRETVYYNLSVIYRKVDNYKQALYLKGIALQRNYYKSQTYYASIIPHPEKRTSLPLL